jgi:hypothetical protein
MKRTLLVFTMLVGSLIVVGAASATEPTRETIQLVSRTTNVCSDGTRLAGVFDVTREITTFYDSDDTPVRQLWVASFEGAWTNPLTGASLPARGIRIFHIDLTTGAMSTTGTNVITKLPDGGVAIGGAGRLAFDAQGRVIEHDGPDTAAERAQLCAALGAS